jgi:replicative DNA helicase
MTNYNNSKFKKTTTEDLFKNKDDNYVPPQEPDIEQIVLGTILLEGSTIDKIMNEFSPNLFFVQRNVLIAEAVISLYKKNSGIDLVTIVSELKLLGSLQEVGGASYISGLTDRIAGSSHLEYHVRLLQEAALKRNIIQISAQAIRKCYSEQEDAFDVLAEQQNGLESSLKSLITYRIRSISDINTELIKTSLEILQGGGKSGVITGLKMLDNVTNGFQSSDLIILAGRPSMGKTAAAVSMCIYPSMVKKIPIAIFSLEMSSEQLVSRVQSFLSGVDVSKIVKKQLTLDEIDKIAKSSMELDKTPLFIDDTPNISLLELKGKCRKLVKEDGVQMIVIDYLQLMRSGLKTNSREQEIAEISRGLKIIAKELKVPVIALSQLSRGVESRGDKKPMLQDLRESGQIEQDADMVMFCYRPEYYNIEDYEVGGSSFSSEGLFMFIIAKHRNGELGEIPLKFIGEQTKITDYYTTNFIAKPEPRAFSSMNLEEKKENIKEEKNNTDFFSKSNEEEMPF